MTAPFAGTNHCFAHRFARLGLAVLLAAGGTLVYAATLSAQGQLTAAQDDLRRELEAKFDIVPVTNGVVLTPKSRAAGFRSIEVSDDGSVSIDGALVNGRELTDKLGADAQTILNLSYQSAAGRRAIVAPPPAPAPRDTTPSAPRDATPPSPRDRRSPRFNIRTRNNNEDRVHIGGGVTVNQGEIVEGDAVAVGGPMRVLGEVRGDVVGVGGDVELGPYAVVGRNVVVVGGTLHRDASAQIGGEVQEIGWSGMADWMRGRWFRRVPGSPGFPFGASLSLMLQIVRISVLAVLALLVVLLAGNYVERISLRASQEPLKAGAIGFLAQILFIPILICTVVLLVVTIVGIPLLLLVPFAILGLILLALVGFTGVAFHIGKLVSARMSWSGGPYAATLIGVVVLAIPVLLARIVGLGGPVLLPITIALAFLGWCVEYVAWTIGFGAVALTRFSKATPPTPSTA
jgi:hypothetical protein